MVSHLIQLAVHEGHGAERVKVLLRKKNKRGETVLHSAICSANIEVIKKLMSEDSDLANVPNDGTSPLYLAISLGRLDIVAQVFQSSKLSYSGPDGQNVLHIAVFRDKALPLVVLWCRCLNSIVHLTKQADKHGCTPLHFAASMDRWHRSYSTLFIYFMTMHLGFPYWFLRRMTREGPTTLLIEANQSSLYQPDKNGSYPIHVAAASGCLKALIIMLDSLPSCATLRDGRGRTFLHVAVEKKRSSTVAFACQNPQFASVWNMQDINGNTAMHLAVLAGEQWIFNCLFQNHCIQLNLSNKDGLTARDLAWIKLAERKTFYYRSNPLFLIFWALQFAGAPYSASRLDHIFDKYIKQTDEDKDSEHMTNASQVMGIVSVLVTTVTFAAAFTLPGGYRGDDHAKGGTPTLSGRYAFDAFVISITLAFICSLLATIGLIYSGFASVDYSIRIRYSNISKLLLHSSVRSLAIAFALNIYLVMAPVALKTAIAACVIIAVGLIFQNFEVRQKIIKANTVRIRFGLRAALHCSVHTAFLLHFWSLAITFILPALWNFR